MIKKVADQQLAIVLYQLVAESSVTDLDDTLSKFASYLVQIGAADRWSAIAEAYVHYWQGQHQVVRAEVISARSLDSQQKQALATKLAKTIKAKEVVIIEKIDTTILGGIIVRLPDRLLDASYRRQLRNLQAKLLY